MFCLPSLSLFVSQNTQPSFSESPFFSGHFNLCTFEISIHYLLEDCSWNESLPTLSSFLLFSLSLTTFKLNEKNPREIKRHKFNVNNVNQHRNGLINADYCHNLVLFLYFSLFPLQQKHFVHLQLSLTGTMIEKLSPLKIL